MNAYEILGVKADASIEDIEKIYKKLAKVYHPDQGFAVSDEKFKEIQEAWGNVKAGKGYYDIGSGKQQRAQKDACKPEPEDKKREAHSYSQTGQQNHYQEWEYDPRYTYHFTRKKESAAKRWAKNRFFDLKIIAENILCLLLNILQLISGIMILAYFIFGLPEHDMAWIFHYEGVEFFQILFVFFILPISCIILCDYLHEKCRHHYF